MKKLKVAIAGCGSITIKRHAPEYAANPNVEIAGFYDYNIARAEELSSKFSSKVYESYEEMLEDSMVDAISICTANAYHAPMTIAALNAGKHVLCEKPMATSIADAIKMIEASDKTGKKLMLAHNQRLANAHKQAKEILTSGELGKILSFKTSFGHSGPENWSVDGGADTWYFKKDNSCTGAMTDLGVHKLDLIRWLLGEEIVEVNAFLATLDKKDSQGEPIEIEDNMVCILKTSSGVIGTLNASWTYYGEEDNSTILYCAEGIMKIYSGENPLVVIKKDGTTTRYKAEGIQTNDSQVNSGIIYEFVDSIINKRVPLITGDDGLAVIEIMNACTLSAETGKTVNVAL